MLDLRTGKHFNGSDNGSFNGSLTRRETIKGGLGLAAILAAGKAPAMLLGARGVAFGKEPLPYGYVSDGLIDYWDGDYITSSSCKSLCGYRSNLIPQGGALILPEYRGIIASITQSAPIFVGDKVYGSNEIATLEMFINMSAGSSKGVNFGISASCLVNGAQVWNQSSFSPIRTQLGSTNTSNRNIITINSVNITYTNPAVMWYGEIYEGPIATTITIVRNGNSYAGYVNGVQHGSGTFSAVSSALSFLNLRGYESERKIRCWANSIRIYNKALTVQQILQNRSVDVSKNWVVE